LCPLECQPEPRVADYVARALLPANHWTLHRNGRPAVHVGTAALGCPVERSSTALPAFFAGGWEHRSSVSSCCQRRGLPSHPAFPDKLFTTRGYPVTHASSRLPNVD